MRLGARPLRIWLVAMFAAVLCAMTGIAAAEMPSPSAEPITPVPIMPPTDASRMALGARLFNDTRLSGDGTKSCASCHDVMGNGALPRRPDSPPTGMETLTVFNAVLSFRLSWEGKFRTLEDQAAFSIEGPAIMGGNLAAIVEKLRADPQMLRMFGQAYGAPPDRSNIVDALASYERTLLTPNSPFDRWLRGDKSALSAEAERGYRNFKDLGCVTCHQGVNVGGNLFQKQGIFRPLASPKPELLRVPSLRNIATTPPYFHDGSAPTLPDAVRRMGLAQLNEELSDFEVGDLVAFLTSLTGEYRGRPVRAPQ